MNFNTSNPEYYYEMTKHDIELLDNFASIVLRAYNFHPLHKSRHNDSIGKSNLHDWECRQIPEWINIGGQQ